MDYDVDRVDEVVLALLNLTSFKFGPGWSAWKGHDWDVLDRLHSRGFISNPRSRAKSVRLTEDGRRRSQELFQELFALGDVETQAE
ncbi:MAG: hypothetical protein GF331_20090 [Chitinivibrionales bacterium]|nr:hypothetical protein [Chitinivibrionales bacterium]